MLKKIVFATNNSHKLEELRRLTKGKIEILSLSDINCHDDIPETADTLEGNALIKTRWVKERYGYDCFADDTGLEVDALDGAPGVLSARYAGECHDSQANMRLLLSNLGDNTNRKARFRTVIALIEGKEERLMDGVVEGEITQSPSGENGFGYDPIFKPMGFNVTFAEMGADEKNQISHRGRAVAKLLEYFSL
ncbi:MAG: non-canonical purine NTP diphosphatase [Muribaculaceae bacterium]|nr:non-canonical purine NTP diphosphatase [Muribaculaceae bacterium]